MKRILSAVLCLLCALLILSSCGSNETKTKFIRGTVSNNVYISGVAKIRFAPGPAWEFGDETSIVKMNGIEPDSVKDENELAEKLNLCASIYDMTAEDTRSVTSVAVIYENLGVTRGAEKLTLDEYVEKLKSEVEEKYINFEASVQDAEDRKIGDLDFRSVRVSLVMDGTDLVQYYYVSRLEGFIMSISVMTTPDRDVDGEILTLFEPYE